MASENDDWEDVPSASATSSVSSDGWEDVPSNPTAPEAKGPSFDQVVTSINGKGKGKRNTPADPDPTLGDAILEGYHQAVGQNLGFDRPAAASEDPIDQAAAETDPSADHATDDGSSSSSPTGPGLVDMLASAFEGLWAPVSAGAAGAGYGIARATGADASDAMRAGAQTAELANVGGLAAGMDHGGPSAISENARLLQGAFDNGASAETILKMNPKLDPEQVAKAVDFRDKGGKGAKFVPDEPATNPEVALQNDANTFVLNRNIDNANTAPTQLEQEAAAFKAKPEPTVEDVFPTAEGTAAKEVAMSGKLQAEADAFHARNNPESTDAAWEDAPVTDAKPEVDPEYAKALAEHTDAISTHVDDVTSDWNNKPDIKTVATVNDLPDGLREKVMAEGADAKGVIDDQGKVHLIAENIQHPEDASGVVFHEALGHHGLVQQFGDRLDGLMDKMYDTNTGFRSDVNDWMSQNPSAYTDKEAGERRRLAAEEVLAERSEMGPATAKVLDVLKNNVKSFGRRMGLKLAYSDREIDTILGMAHDAVINGVKAAADNGFRLSRGDGQKFRPKASMTQSTMETKHPVADLSDFLHDRTVSAGPVSDPELQRMADDLGLTASKYVKTRSLGDDKVAAKIKAAHQILTNQMDELAGLGQKAREEGMTPSLFADIQERLKTVDAVYAKFDEDTTELGRALRALKQVSQSRKSAQATIKFMKDAEASGAGLGNPEAVNQLLEHLNRSSNELSPAEQAKLVRDAGKTSLKDHIASVLNLPRSLMSSVDLSAPFRQGLFLVNRKEFWNSFAPMLKSAVSEKAYDGLMAEIRSRPTFPLMQKAGLAISDVHGGSLTAHEEAFMSNLVKKIPVVAGSERAYSAFLNKLRADTFDTLKDLSEKAGYKMMEKADGAKSARPTPQLKGIARFVNSATGRGDFKALGGAGPMINATFFSPRLIKSRVDLINPAFYAGLPPVVRHEAIKSLLSLGALGVVVTSLAQMGGAKVEHDYRSSDAGKIKVGNTRYDIGGGFNQEITLATRLATNQTKPINGKPHELGEKYGQPDAYDIVAKYARNKLGPIPSLLVDLRTGKDAVGQKVTPSQAIAQRFIPLFLQDYYQVAQDVGYEKGAAMAVPAAFGVSMQTFNDKKKPNGK